MSFVIKDVKERGLNDDDNEFDMEPYNYMFNKRTSFTDSEFIIKDSDELKTVLEEMEKKGSEQLSMLKYTRPIEIEAVQSKPENEEGPGLSNLAGALNPLDLDLFEQEQIVAEADSALHLALTNNAALNVDVILYMMSQDKGTDAS